MPAAEGREDEGEGGKHGVQCTDDEGGRGVAAAEEGGKQKVD